MPRTSCEWIIADIVALVAVDAALASAARMLIILRSAASISSGATIYLLALSAESGGKPEDETVLPAVAGAAVPVA
eukprot:2481516-Pleurochrysis_carterae.AAC.2